MPVAGPQELLVRGLVVGICGTDREIASAEYGEAPDGERLLILGHEAIGEVQEAPPGSSLSAGDLVAAVVRRPDPEPCPACRKGRYDLCSNDSYFEAGIKGLHGYGSEFWTIPTQFAVPVPRTLGLRGVLIEPMSVVMKAWESALRLAGSGQPEQHTVLVIGAGTIGLLCAMVSRRYNHETHVAEVISVNPRPRLVRDLGATYHTDATSDVIATVKPSLVFECSGDAGAALALLSSPTHNSAICLLGMPDSVSGVTADLGLLYRLWVLHNTKVFGSVSSSRAHYIDAADVLVEADPHWLDRLVQRRLPLAEASEVFQAGSSDIKVLVDLGRPDVRPRRKR